MMISAPFETLQARASSVAPGLLLAATIASAASFLAGHYGAPVMLFALLLGMSFNFLLTDENRCAPGIELASKTLLRVGVALLGIRISLGDIADFGFPAAMAISGLVVITIATGFLAAATLGRRWRFGLLTGGAVAICGASAALAIAALIDRSRSDEQDTLFTVLAVTLLSTVAMVAYPILFVSLSFEDVTIGLLIGATIHDVAQVVGAGFSVSEQAGESATIAKLFRVALLPVVLLIIAVALRSSEAAGSSSRPVLPGFLIAFVALAVLNSTLDLPEWLVSSVSSASRILLVAAIAALGVKTSLRVIHSMGVVPMSLVVIETFVLLVAAAVIIPMVL